MNKKRCVWVKLNNPLYVTYHDDEWAVPVFDDQKLFEFIVLESAQAGLSWEIILKKREGYRKAFKNFDPRKVARMGETDVENLMRDESIIRNRLKITATISNAAAFLKVQKEYGSFATYMWQWVNDSPLQNDLKHRDDIPAKTELAEAMAKDLKKRGFKFLGPTVWYAHMQAVGMVNDHTTDCFRHKEVQRYSQGSHKKQQ